MLDRNVKRSDHWGLIEDDLGRALQHKHSPLMASHGVSSLKAEIKGQVGHILYYLYG